jgi:hypothetical protein
MAAQSINTNISTDGGDLSYVQCVIKKQNGGALIKRACEERFLKVMDCFKNVRRREESSIVLTAIMRLLNK